MSRKERYVMMSCCMLTTMHLSTFLMTGDKIITSAERTDGSSGFCGFFLLLSEM